jgi:hypothetical protein
VRGWLYTGFELEIGFIDHFNTWLVTALIIAPSLISTLYKSLQHTPSLFSLLCLPSRSLVTSSNSGYSLAFALTSLPAGSRLHRLSLLFSGSLTAEQNLSLSLMLRPTVSWPVCLGIKHPSGAYDQIFVTVRQLRVWSCGALSLTRGRVCRLQILLAFASAVILGSESRGTRDPNVLSQIRDFPFRRLLRLAGSRWRYSTPPPHGSEQNPKLVPLIIPWHGPCRKHRFQQFLYCCAMIHCRGDTFAKALLSNGCVYLLIRNLLPSNGRCFVACFAVVIQKGVYTLQYTN